MKLARRLAVALAVALVAALALSATSGAKQTTDSTQLGPTETGSAKAACPNKTHAVAGGYAGDFNPSFLVGPEVLTYGSHPSSGDWKSSGQNVSDGTGDLKSFAYCAKHPAVDVARDETQIAASDGSTFPTGKAVAHCPAGEEVISGGFDNPDFGSNVISDPEIFPYTSKRQGNDAWIVRGESQGGAEATLVAYAVCSKQAPKLAAHTASDTVPALSDTTVGTQSLNAPCGKGERVVSGGFQTDQEGPTQADPFVGYPTSRKSHGAWRVAATNSGGQDGDATAIAYCKS